MSLEIAAALAVAAAWWTAAAASTSRHRLGLERFFSLTCWLVGAVGLVGGLLALVTGEEWWASVTVWIAVGVVLGVRVLTAADRADAAPPIGRAAVGLWLVSLVLGALLVVAVSATAVVTDWPPHPGAVGTFVIVAIGVGTAVLQVIEGTRWSRRALWTVCVLGVVPPGAAAAVIAVHLVSGDLTSTSVHVGEAIVAASLAGVLGVAGLPLVVRLADDGIHRGRPDAEIALARLDEVLQRRMPLDETLLQAAELLRSTLLLERVEVWSATDHQLQLAVSDPFMPGRSVALDDTARRVAANAGADAHGGWVRTWIPGVLAEEDEQSRVAVVTYGGDLRGLLTVHGERAGDDYAIDLLVQVARRLGPAMHSASLDASLAQSLDDLRTRERELRASRERLVAAADFERARIERDLHDGAQQHLVALGVNLQLVRGLVRSDPDRADALLAELTTLARSAAEELRSLSRGIYPQTLTDAGVGSALDEAAQRHADTEIRVTSVGVERYTAEIEAAVYFVCNEAITNAVKHARAGSVTVTLVAEGDELVFEVADDGVGFGVGPDDSTSGLTNMADRLGAVDGTLTIRSDGDGTRVVGTVPLA
ncbi:MAG: sensor histidine kinase [Acidimicrobiales bacterium]|nr:sensor histidine kinase [Acidimicrobiales bacterium]